MSALFLISQKPQHITNKKILTNYAKILSASVFCFNCCTVDRVMVKYDFIMLFKMTKISACTLSVKQYITQSLIVDDAVCYHQQIVSEVVCYQQQIVDELVCYLAVEQMKKIVCYHQQQLLDQVVCCKDHVNGPTSLMKFAL